MNNKAQCPMPPIEDGFPTQTPSQTDLLMQFEIHKKSLGTAYIVWFLFGWLGGHRYYLRKRKSAIAMTVIFALSLLLLSLYTMGMLGFLVLFIWILVDACLIPRWTRDYNTALAGRLEGRGSLVC